MPIVFINNRRDVVRYLQILPINKIELAGNPFPKGIHANIWKEMLRGRILIKGDVGFVRYGLKKLESNIFLLLPEVNVEVHIKHLTTIIFAGDGFYSPLAGDLGGWIYERSKN